MNEDRVGELEKEVDKWRAEAHKQAGLVFSQASVSAKHARQLRLEREAFLSAANKLLNVTSPFVVATTDQLHAARAGLAALVDKR